MESIERVSVIDEIVERIRQKIANKEYKPGEKLPSEKELCEQLGVGRSSVREAFRVLQTLGYVEIERGKGAFAAQGVAGEANIKSWFAKKETDLEEYLDVRLSMEPYAANLAAQRGTADEKVQLAEIFSKYKRAAQNNEHSKLTLLDEKFHQQIISMTHNSILLRMSETIFAEFAPALAKVILLSHETGEAVFFHEKILEAIIKGDGGESEKLMRAHLLLAERDIKNITKNKQKKE